MMRQPKLQLALAMIVKGSPEEAISLQRTLSLAYPYVDKIFITITQPCKEVEDVCVNFSAVVSHFEWCNDFAAARNFNFSQVPKEYHYILWMDADDGIRGLEKLKKIIAKNRTIDVFALNYLYAFDENKNPIVVHHKTQIVKNDGCVIWRGRLHEDFEPTRQLTRFFIKGIERIHLSTTDRFEASKKRNLEVSLAQVEAEPKDPRSYWNLGNSYKGLNKNEEALAAFDTFLTMSQSDEEKYIARIRMADAYWRLGNRPKALDECRYAIGTKPNYPDAYHLAGHFYLEMRQYEDAVKKFLDGLTKKPPETSILVYNPRDYDYTPLKNLAKAFFSMDRPDQSLICLKQALEIMPDDEDTKRLVKIMERESANFDDSVKLGLELAAIENDAELLKRLDSLPPEIQSHPRICVLRNLRFIKKESSGRDLVFFCGATAEVWNPETAKEKGIGGSEEAIIWLSELLSKKGWNVTVYANMGLGERKFGDVTWKPFWMWNTRDRQDVVILWRHPRFAKYDINCENIFVDLHDVVPEGEFTEDRLKKIKKIFVKSHFQRTLLPNVPDEKFVVVPNGIDSSIFDKCVCGNGGCEGNHWPEAERFYRDPLLMVNTSSAERSLTAALDCYEEIKKQVPDAKFKWAYGWNVWDASHTANATMTEWKEATRARMKTLGVEEMGRLSHSEIAKLYLRANIFFYPTEFAEIDCISLSKAMAAGAIPITSDFAALGEKKGHGGIFLHSKKTKSDWCAPYQFDFASADVGMKKQWVADAVRFLKNPPSEQARESMREWARFTYSWEKVVDMWMEVLQLT